MVESLSIQCSSDSDSGRRMVSSRQIIRRIIYGLSALAVLGHIMAIVTHYSGFKNFFGITLMKYPQAKGVIEVLAILASVLLGVGAWKKRPVMCTGYIVFATAYLIIHLGSSAYMIVLFYRFFGFDFASMKSLIIPAVTTLVLLSANIGFAVAFIIQRRDVTKPRLNNFVPEVPRLERVFKA